MNLALETKRVLVTGSSRGIGLAIAQGFLEERSRVMITGRSINGLESARVKLREAFPNEEVLSAVCDFTSPSRIDSLVAVAKQEWQGLDVLICNVGSGRSVADAIPSAPDFDRVFSLNFDSAVRTARAFYPLLKESKGNIIFISSIAGVEALGAPVDYSTAKAALLAFAKNLAKKSAADGIRVNVIAPGNIFFQGGVWDEKAKADPEGVERTIRTTVPMKRFGVPDEVANAALFLCSEKASFVTGACLIVDGGQTATFF